MEKTKLHKRGAGSYFFEREVKGGDNEIVNIFQIQRNLWGWGIGKGMTKGTYKTKKEVLSALLPEEYPPVKIAPLERASKTFEVIKDGEYLGVFNVKQMVELLGIKKMTMYKLCNSPKLAAQRGLEIYEIGMDNETYYEQKKYELAQEFVEVCQQLKPKLATPTTNGKWVIKRIPNDQKPKVNGFLEPTH